LFVMLTHTLIGQEMILTNEYKTMVRKQFKLQFYQNPIFP
jgi:hypothetical protein